MVPITWMLTFTLTTTQSSCIPLGDWLIEGRDRDMRDGIVNLLSLQFRAQQPLPSCLRLSLPRSQLIYTHAERNSLQLTYRTVPSWSPDHASQYPTTVLVTPWTTLRQWGSSEIGWKRLSR